MKYGQHEPIVQLGAPARQAGGVRLAPEARDQGAEQQLLRDAHARVRRHLEGPQLEQAAPARRDVRRIELVDAELRAVRVAGDVDQQVTQRAIDEPGRRRAVRRREARERDLDLVEAVVPPFIDPRRLARRAEKQPGEEIRQRRVVVPVGDQASQQVGPPEERAVCRRRAAQHEVIAAAGPGVASVEHELLGSEARLPARPRRAPSSARRADPSRSAGCTFTSITPGSGVTRKCGSRGSSGGG